MAEVRVLEYWRKKYARQAIIVGVLAGVCVVAGVFFATYFGVKVLAVGLGCAFFYVMFKAICDDFQARFEGALLMDASRKFPNLLFDIGRGSGEETLLSQSVCPAYNVYECFNVIKGEGFVFEEVQLLEDVRFLGGGLPVFDGIILRVSLARGQSSAQGTVSLFHDKLVLEGETAALLQPAKGEVLGLLKHFSVQKAKVCVNNGAVYFWLHGATKLYAQVTLFSYNSPALFDKRIESLQTTGNALRDKLLGV